jgi:hypothetical protein
MQRATYTSEQVDCLSDELLIDLVSSTLIACERIEVMRFRLLRAASDMADLTAERTE